MGSIVRRKIEVYKITSIGNRRYLKLERYFNYLFKTLSVQLFGTYAIYDYNSEALITIDRYQKKAMIYGTIVHDIQFIMKCNSNTATEIITDIFTEHFKLEDYEVI